MNPAAEIKNYEKRWFREGKSHTFATLFEPGLLEVVNSPKYKNQIKEAIQLITSAKGWYDSTALREQV